MRQALLLLLLTFPVFAWGDYVRVERNANIYASSNRQSAVLDHIDPAESGPPVYLVVASDQLQNGYHEVLLRPGNGTGWIYKSLVRKFSGIVPGSGRNDVYGGYPEDSHVGDQITRVVNTGYVVGYSENKTDPLWVAYSLGPNQGIGCPRLSRFLVDDRTQARIVHDDYNNSGFDRGHMAPSSNIGSRYGCAAQNETYRMSNVVPQIPALNQRSWGALENLEDDYATSFGRIWTITGPIFDPEWLDRLCSGVEIPGAFYKIIVHETNGVPHVLATIFNQDTRPGTKLSALVTTVDEIELRTGIDFLTWLPDSLESTIESTPATGNEWRLETALDTNFPGAQRPFCKLPRIRRDQVD